MKKIFTYITVVLITGILFNSCETTELDLSNDPNALTPSQANTDFYLNAAQERFARSVDALGEVAAEVTRIEWMGTRNYQNAYSPASFDLNWERLYQEVLKNLRDMNVLAEEGELYYHIAMGQVMEAYTMTLLVDMFGDVPYSEAIAAPEILNPALDSGADVYAATLSLLDEAEANFNRTSAALPQNDFFYGGDSEAWIKAINTLKLRIYRNTGNIDAFEDIIDDDNYISSTEEDFQFSWGSNAVQPDTRHPNYAQTYTAQGAQGDYASIWLMNLMQNTEDPRIRYYFYRQSATVPGAPGVAPNEETLSCSVTTAPPHYLADNVPYCSLPNGYWGRNHGNDEGIPPDGFLRVAPGVYPQAGQFDDSSFAEIALGSGGGGAGITPMLLASTVDFWRAEIAMADGDTEDAKDFMLDGIEKSIDKVQSFGSVDGGADLSEGPTDAEDDAFLNDIGAAFDDVDADMDDKWNVLADQFFVALKGNGHDAYNFYRRTGYPLDLQPNIEPDPGAFIRSFFYPANAANNNANIPQKDGVTTQVFWDTNPASPGFPAAN